jgi:prepilin-type N-terminal cleavage/methylation domain-containing protein
MDSDHKSQAGFTLIEVLLTTTITGMIIAAIASACYVGIHTTSDDRRSLDQSNAEQIAAHYFVADVQEACDPALSSPTCPRSPNPSTASSSACGSNALFAMDSLSSATGSAADTTVAYVLQSSTLTRLSCAYGSTTVATSTTLATNVTAAAVSYPVTGGCSGQFQLTLTLLGSTLNGTPDYNVTLCAQRRA